MKPGGAATRVQGFEWMKVGEVLFEGLSWCRNLQILDRRPHPVKRLLLVSIINNGNANLQGFLNLSIINNN